MSPAVAVFPHSSGLVTLTYAAAHFISRGGVELAEVRHESLGVLSAGVMCASGRTPAVALCGAGTADGTEGSGPSLALMDLSTAQLTVQLPLEIVPTVVQWEGRSGLLVLGGGDGLARVFDVRSGLKAVGAAPLFQQPWAAAPHTAGQPTTPSMAHAILKSSGPRKTRRPDRKNNPCNTCNLWLG